MQAEINLDRAFGASDVGGVGTEGVIVAKESVERMCETQGRKCDGDRRGRS